MSRIFAYCRVSTAEQTAENQKQEILKAGFAVEPFRFIEEQISGDVPARNRPAFSKLIDRLEPGDILVVTKIDRLGRSAADVQSTVELLARMEVRVYCIALGGADLTSSTGKMTMQILAAIAAFERNLIVERTNAGVARARAQGKRIGRPPALTSMQEKNVLRRLEEGSSIRRIAKEYNVSRSTIKRISKKLKQVEDAVEKKPLS